MCAASVSYRSPVERLGLVKFQELAADYVEGELVELFD